VRIRSSTQITMGTVCADDRPFAVDSTPSARVGPWDHGGTRGEGSKNAQFFSGGGHVENTDQLNTKNPPTKDFEKMLKKRGPEYLGPFRTDLYYSSYGTRCSTPPNSPSSLAETSTSLSIRLSRATATANATTRAAMLCFTTSPRPTTLSAGPASDRR
jgi:hypothetical protein